MGFLNSFILKGIVMRLTVNLVLPVLDSLEQQNLFYFVAMAHFKQDPYNKFKLPCSFNILNDC